MSSNVQKKVAVNLRTLLSESILNPLKGSKALEIALGELTNNSFDAQSTEIRIKIDSFEGKPALFIMDNGLGFSHSGIISILSYAYSDKSSKDLSSVGLWGTGSKLILGLGNLSNTEVTTLSFSKDYPEGVSMKFNFDYLVDLAEKKIDGENNITRGVNQQDFHSDWKRKTGSTIILTGFDGRKVSIEKIIKALSERLSTKMAPFVNVLVEGEYQPITTAFIDGKLLEYSINFPTLGEISLEIYYAGSNEGPEICGPFNTVCDFPSVFSSLTKEQKSKVTRLWLSIGGYIYIEKIKLFRTHDNSLSQDFYHGPAVEEFVQMLEVVSGELKKLEENEKKDADTAKKWDILRKISEASQSLYKIPSDITKKNFNGGPMVAKPGTVDQPIFLVPRDIDMACNEEVEITLYNKGTNQSVGFNDVMWVAKPQLVSIGGKGRTAKLKSGKNEGMCIVEITGGFGKHHITVQVGEKYKNKTPFIAGPKHVNPGDVLTYYLKCYTNAVNPDWFISSDGVTIEKREDKDITIKISEDISSSDFMIQCFGVNNKIVASKRIIVTDNKGPKGSPMITFGDVHYMIDFSMAYPNCLSQIEDDGDIPVIVINPNFENSKKFSYYTTTRDWVSAIAFAASAHQIHNQKLTAVRGMAMAYKFIADMVGKILG